MEEIIQKLANELLYVSDEELDYLVKHIHDYVREQKEKHVSGTVG